VSSSAGGSFSGRGTWFTDTTGSCDIDFDTNDMIVAMNAAQMGGTSQCGKSVKVSYGGKTVTAKVVDTCPSQYCTSGALDLSQAVFKKLAPLDVGVINIKWSFA
ncbi:MAG: RlpA-like double-psi beta-barrel-protein domain-containing protein-containing protein, partial [Linnemannia gamsii]